jgi:hypothetical protein
LCEGFRPKPSQKAHWVTEQGLRGHAALEAEDAGDLESSFEEQMVALCEAYVAGLPPAIEDLREVRIDTILDRWGYADRVRFRSATVADLIDWKFVRVKEVADAEFNLQGIDYVVGLFEARPELVEIHVHFPMPRFRTVTTATFRRDQLPALKLQVFATLRRAQRSDAPNYRGKTLTPHIDVCTYCGAAGNCRALRQIVDATIRKYDPDGYGRLPPVPEETHSSRVKDPAQRAQLQQLASVAKTFAESVSHHNLAAAMESAENLPTGYEIDYRKSKRRVTSPAALLLVAREFGLSSDDLIGCASLAWTKVEELIREKAPKGTKSRVVVAFNHRLQELDAVDRAEDVPTLRRVSK